MWKGTDLVGKQKEHRGAADPPWLADWREAQAGRAAAMAEAAAGMGRLDATLAGLDAADAQGARMRLALAETEAMLWAQGLILGRDEIGRDLMEARAGTDRQAMRLARWAIRRLDGQGAADDLAGFLGLHRARPLAGMGPEDDAPEALRPRPRGPEFDDAAAGFLDAMTEARALHPLARGPVAMMMWRRAGLSAPETLIEAGVWSARDMAQGCEALRFLPMGRHGRRVWTGFGTPAERLAAHLSAVTEGTREARAQVLRVIRWASVARAATDGIKGGTAARVIAVLAARPLVAAAEVETGAAISRVTAERMLNRMTEMGLVREITAARRFRLWAAELAAS